MNFNFDHNIDLSFATDAVIGWILGVIASIVAFYLVQRIPLMIQRHQMLQSVEKEWSDLFSLDLGLKKGENDTYEPVNLRTTLGEKWEINGEQFLFQTQRFLPIGLSNYIATRALQDSLSWFRRVYKMKKDRILLDEDLADMWRQILPFGCEGRFDVFREYFGEDDIEAMYEMIELTAKACKKLNRQKACQYWADNQDSPFRQNKKA